MVLHSIKKRLWLALLLLTSGVHLHAQVINCSSGFASSGSCGVSLIGSGGQPWAVVGTNGGTTPSLSGSAVELIQVPPGGHVSLSLIYQAAVNVQAFTATYAFTANGHNIAFVLSNTSNTDGNGYPFDSKAFAAGAGCEGGFFQAFPGPGPNNVLALNLDSGNAITNGAGFTYSNAQIYQEQQDPCNPTNTGGYYTTKISTSPVPLNNPAGTALTTTGHNYSATISYDGANLNLCLYDITAANGSCSSGTSGTGTFFQKTWTGINIPSIVGMNTAYTGLVSGDNSDAPASLLINSFVYTVNTPPSTPTLSTYTSTAASGAAFATSPVFSPAAGTYSGTQNVTISNSTGSSYFCYILSASVPSIFPWPDSLGGCTVGTKYTGAISVPSTQTLYAVAGTGLTVSLPSSQVAGAYTISAAPASGSSLSPGVSLSPKVSNQ